MIKLPLAVPACLFAAGIAWAHVMPMEPAWLLAAAFLAAATACWRGGTSPSWLLPCCVLAGAAHLTVTTAILHPDDLRRRPAGAALVAVEGTLATTPEQRLRHRNGAWRTNTLALVRVAQVTDEASGEPRAAHGFALVTTPGALPEEYGRGRRIRIAGVLDAPRGPQAPGLFDYAHHLALRGIHHELRTTGAPDWQVTPQAPGKPWHPPWDERFQRWARATLALGLPEEDAALRLLWSMTLGWKTGLTDEVEEPFMRTGTMHLFAISGLHIALIAAIVAQALRLFLLPRALIALVVLPVAWAYTAATGWQPSAVRATLMTSVVVGSWLLARPPELLNSLALAALAILIWDPCQLFQAGFQLSFVVVAAIALLQPPLSRGMARLGAPDPLVPRDLVPRTHRVLHAAWEKVAASIAVSVAAWIGSLPLAAHYFHLCTPSSLLANLVLVPLSSAALACNLGALVCGTWLSTFTEWFNHSAWFWMRGMMRFSEFAAAWPAAASHVAAWPLGLVAFWYLAIGLTGLRRRPRRGTILLLAGISLICLIAALAEWAGQRRDLRLSVLPLGGGHAVWVDAKSQSRTLIDTGNAASVEFVIAPFLQAQGLDELPTLMLTHGDARHTGGATELAAAVPPHQLWIGPTEFRSSAHRRTLEALSRLPGTTLLTIKDPEDAFPFRAWHPRPQDRYPRADDACLVLGWEHQGGIILMAGDLGAPGQQALLQRHPLLRADLVIAGLHDRGATLSPSVLAHLRTRWLIVADDRMPASARAKPEVRRALRNTPTEVWFTSDTGALDLHWREGRLEWRDTRGGILATHAWPPGRRSVLHKPGVIPGDEIEDGHAHGEAVGDLLQDH